MMKKVFLIVGIVLLLIIGVIVYFVVTDLQQEEIFITEITEIVESSNSEDLDLDEFRERLNTIKTRGDYAVLEKAAKQYFTDVLDNNMAIQEVLSSNNWANILQVQNYISDGPEFKNTKQYISETKTKLEEGKNKYVEFLTDEKMMSYIDNKNLDSYYTDLYKQYFIGEEDNSADIELLEQSLDSIISYLDKAEDVIDFLIENKGNWEINGDRILFSNENLTNEYNNLLNAVYEDM